MMNYIWAVMIGIGIIYAALTGNMETVTDAILDSSKESITLCMTMLGIVMMWTGVMEIAEEAGIVEGMMRGIRPVMRYLFPRIPEEHPAGKYIALNCVANILGLGWAATPAGLRAMEELANLEEERRDGRYPGPVKKPGVASDEMCAFLVLNISSLQLIPVNIIAYRSQYGSADPAGIIVPAILATSISTVAAIIFINIMQYQNPQKRESKK